MTSEYYYLSEIDELNFRVYTDDEIEAISVMEITSEDSVNALGHSVKDGIYDLRMGPMGFFDDVCQTCKKNFFSCPGHFGYIKLPLPLHSPVFTDVLQKLLQKICFSCHRFQAQPWRVMKFLYEMKLLNEGYPTAALGLKISQHDLSELDETQPQQLKKDLIKMESFLRDQLIEVRKASPSEGHYTNNSQAVYQKLLKRFFGDMHPKKKCLFCNARKSGVLMQYSRIFLKKSSKSDDLLDNDEDAILPLNNDENASYKSFDDNETQDTEMKDTIVSGQSYITAEQAQMILRKCSEKDGALLEALYPVLKLYKKDLKFPTDIFFIKNLLVTPPKSRPVKKMGSLMLQSEKSQLYEKLVSVSKALSFLVNYIGKELKNMPDETKVVVDQFKGDTVTEKTHTIWHTMQSFVDNIFDSEINKGKKAASKGIRQIVEKKQGLFRKNLMGKRVNFSARSVIAPDPMLAMDEVGVPIQFATALSYRCPVTAWNVNKLRQMVINGPVKYPGACMVEDEEGKLVRLPPDDIKKRTAIANKLFTPLESAVKEVNPTKIVYKHLESGDWVLMNRQPTLHKSSIQAHKAKVMRGEKVLRMPYANCKAYNADFDGDEMNMHFPQNELSRSEAKNIMSCWYQYLTSKDGSPLRGLIQDCVVASVMISIRGNFFDKEDYQQLVYFCLSGLSTRIKTLPPAILKPKKLWSGKQLFSTILHNIIPETKKRPTFEFNTKLKPDMWQTTKSRLDFEGSDKMSESYFVMSDGELLCGIVDKCAIGSTSYGLVHVCHDLYGGAVSNALLTSINKLCVYYLQLTGHTISIKEFISSSKAASKRRRRLQQLVDKAPFEVSKKLNISPEDLSEFIEKNHMSRSDQNLADVDAAYTMVLGPVTSTVTRDNEKGLVRPFLDNHMKLMVDSGSKGSGVNMNQMASLFGSVAMDGKRMPMSLTGKTLPSFKSYDADPRFGGYIPDRFMTGIDCKSYFFLCIVGRDSLQHTAVKTANSGYMQRCLMKHLESIRVEYDMTARNCNGTVLQFSYGEDGLDVSKIPFLATLDSLDVIVRNQPYDRNNNLSQSAEVKSYKKMVKKFINPVRGCKQERKSGFLTFSKEYSNSLTQIGKTFVNGRSTDSFGAVQHWRDLSLSEKSAYEVRNVPPPLASIFPTSKFGVVSEVLENLIEKYCDYKLTSTDSLRKFTKKEVARTIYTKIMDSQVEPGEAVGALCAQALGEPLTQMTLNTFHFAGRDELNVTLGVPRMIEILKTASENISTPIMEVPFKDGVTKKKAEKVKKKLTPVPFSKVIRNVKITSFIKSAELRYKQYDILFEFVSYKEYKSIFMLTPSRILKFVEGYFIRKVLIDGIRDSLKKQGTFCSTQSKSKTRDLRREEYEKTVREDFGEEFGAEEEEKEAEDSGNRVSESEDEDEDIAIEETDGVRKVAVEDDYDSESGEMENEENASEEGVEEAANEEEYEDFMSMYKKKKFSSGGGSNLDQLMEHGYEMRVNHVLLLDPWVVNYSYDGTKQEWCKLSLLLPIDQVQIDVPGMLRMLINRTSVHHISGIKKAFLVEQDEKFLLRTEGVNMKKIFEYQDVLDVNKLYTNNIKIMADTFGVEAAQRTIIKEIRSVQDAYDITIDFRHLSLLADYFTCEGVYKACSRHAISTCASPIQKITYETAFSFLKDALLEGRTDTLDSPSASVLVGQAVKVGTNTFDILTKLPA